MVKKAVTGITVEDKKIAITTKKDLANVGKLANRVRENLNAIFGEETAVPPIEIRSDVKRVIKIGLPHLEKACAVSSKTGEYGFPIGRTVAIFGRPKSGKSTLCIEIAASIIKQGGFVIYIDQERTMQWSYIKSILRKYIIDTESIEKRFILLQPSKEMVAKNQRLTIEEVGVRVFNINKKLKIWRKDQYVPVGMFWDTISMTPSEAEMKRIGKTNKAKDNPEADNGKASNKAASAAQPGSHARAFREYFRINYDDIVMNDVLQVLVAQQTSTIGHYSGASYLAKSAIDFNASIVLQVIRRGEFKLKGQPQGIEGEILVRENKCLAPRLRKICYQLYYDEGYDFYYDLNDLIRSSGLYSPYKKVEIDFLGKEYNFSYETIDGLQNAIDNLPKAKREELIQYVQDRYVASMAFEEESDGSE